MNLENPLAIKTEDANMPSVAILMATYNGERFLEEQLESFVNQTEKDWVLWVSDDGSSDNTKSILQKFADRFEVGKVNIVDGPKLGFANNFLSLVNNPAIKAKSYAFSDQDDVWYETKLEKALNFLGAQSNDVPSLYCSRTEYVDENMAHIGFSDDYQRPPSFLNALVQNIASGNTMVFNETARSLMLRTDSSLDIPLHDWWIYIVVTACGGDIFFDSRPSVYYRQHNGNLWGMNTGWANRALRVGKLFEGRFRAWNVKHLEALRGVREGIAPHRRKTLDHLLIVQDGNIFERLSNLKKSGLYRQTLLGNIGLWVAAIFNKM
jgi:glycosyltransferase involved in cell wall biosynthesis